MTRKLHPLLEDALYWLGRHGAKAVAAAADSLLEDIQVIAEETADTVDERRTKIAKAVGKSRATKRRKKPQRIVEVIDAEIVDDEEPR